jgi:hypothetical protein
MEYPNGLKRYTVQRQVNGEIKTYHVLAASPSKAGDEADKLADADRKKR